MGRVMLLLGTCGFFLLYVDRDTEPVSPLITADTNKTAAIVLKVVVPLLKQSLAVWMGNFYNSPCLAKMLKMVHKTVLAH
jgi:hypothetical protein